MKKVFVIMLALLLTITMVGCKSPTEVASEKIAEKVIEGAGGGKVDIDGEKVTIKTEDGSEVLFGGNEWPSDKLGKAIPKLTEGEVTYVANSDDMCMIIIEGVKVTEYEDYVQEAKASGYTQGEVNFSDNSTKTYMATNADEITLQITYLSESEEVSITAGKNKQ